MSERKTIEQIAERILDQNPDPVVRFRLLRDVLRAPPDADDVIRARQRMLRSRWVLQLKREQQPDGGWGRFHSIDTKSSQKVPTTEAAVERGLALGLSAADPVFRGTALSLRPGEETKAAATTGRPGFSHCSEGIATHHEQVRHILGLERKS